MLINDCCVTFGGNQVEKTHPHLTWAVAGTRVQFPRSFPNGKYFTVWSLMRNSVLRLFFFLPLLLLFIISITSACCRTSPHWQTSYRQLTRVIHSCGVVLSPACKFMKLWGATFWLCPFCKWGWNAPFSSWEPPPLPSLFCKKKEKIKFGWKSSFLSL